ncbi:hypothetical protein Sango_2895900 [Sesamum angolense]|uniref:Uncharacterized protein n=1 Tax=Sesamum angolense TaxID=2727404 RepID=A0AAE1VW43_9LAMI|nr:hypothetical protein Sango_2895900 [Sesamum angolense]
MAPKPDLGPPDPSSSGMFIGTVSLNTTTNPFESNDKFVVGFNNSSRKTLSYIPSQIQNGEIIVRPSLELVRNGSHRWVSTVVGYFLGKKPYFHHFKDTVASGIGRPLYQDAITKARMRLDFACVCVILDISSKLPKHIGIMVPKEDGGDVPCRVDIDQSYYLIGNSLVIDYGPVLVFVVYGANDLSVRRDLWQTLCHITDSMDIEPWLVLGDFDALADISEGALFTWHNCSDTSRSLWKRLDRMLVNDRCQVRADYASTESQDPMAEGGRSVYEGFLPEGEIIGEFFGFYRRLLGGEPNTWFLNLLYLRPWANHIVTMEKAQRLLRPVTKEDIKLATFDITEDKSLGSDSYSSGLYKVVWPVIAEEVTGVIMEFFSTGRLPRKLNVTFLALIPKRIREVLDKIISPSQNAFVLGCSIDDNILLAHELFAGYNKNTCLGGARRLRQGDPMSPYLFVLVIEVLHMLLQQLVDQDRDFMFHRKCRELGFFSYASQMIY